jgi:predicted NBD/HSP70 family sugar kinase
MFKLRNMDQETIKDSNKKMIINLLHSQRELTKQQIAKQISVSIPTVISNVNELIEEGLVEEAGVGDSSGGRKPVIVRFKPNSRYSFGVQVNIDSIRIILTNLDSEILEDETFYPEASIGENIKDISNLLHKIGIAINNIIEKHNIRKNSVLGVGISLPGTVNEEKGILEWAPNLEVKNISFESLTEYFEFPVYLENEANAAAVAELKLGVAREMRNLVYISITEGIGTGIVIQDYLYKGKNKRAGEFGHMTIVKGGKPCNCGRKGCWEQYASQNALLLLYNNSGQSRVKGIQEFFHRLMRKEENAEKVWEQYLEYLASGIQNIIFILDPHYIVIGGEISNYEELLIDSLKEKVFIKNSFFCREDIKILASKLKENSSILGASMLPLHKLFYLNDKIL